MTFRIASFLALFSLISAALQPQIAWVKAAEAVPPGAVSPGSYDGRPVYICRAQLREFGVQPGRTVNGKCGIPYRNKIEEVASFEIAVDSNYFWASTGWDGAVIAGQQPPHSDLYVCRVNIVDRGYTSGKAFRDGPHAGHCYVVGDSRELDFIKDFELLYSGKSSHR